MSIDFAQKADLPAWLELVRGVRAAFPGLETEEALAEHGRIVRRFIAGKNAVCAKEGGKLAGALLFCRERGEICFLAVDAAFRRRHIAERMLRLALDEMAGTGEIRVVSYRAEDERGAAARAFYRKMGFEAGRLIEEFGCPVQELLLRRH